MRRFIVLMLYLLIANESFLTIQMHVIRTSTRLIDVTDTLNELMRRKVLSVDIFAEFGFGETGTEAKTTLDFYSPDCSTIQDCVDEINTVGRFWNDTLGRDMLDLRISIPLNNHTLAKLANDNKLNVTLKRPDFQTNYLFNINESISCDDIPDIRNEVWDYLADFTEGEYGIGVNEVLIECKAAAEQIYAREMAVIYFKFGNTVGIPESFGLFRKRMAYMHAETVKIVNKYAPFLGLPDIWYCPAVDAVGDENHHKLLEDYMSEWQDDGINDMQLILRTKVFSSTENGVYETSKFTVVPYMHFSAYSYSLSYSYSSVWMFSELFKELILEYDGWNNWNSDGRKELYKTRYLNDEIEVILDYSIAINNGMIDNTGKPFRNILEGIQDVNSRKPFVVKSILFSIETEESTNYSAQIYTSIGQQITSQGVEVGCVYVLLPEWEMKSVAADIVRACNEINGTLYILHHHVIYLKNDSVNPFYYENTMRKVLESVKELRTLILQFHPSAQVYFKLPIIPMYDTVQEYIRGSAVFCNEKIMSFNELIEAITNWAKLNDFPVILKSAVDSPNHFDYLSWFSYLRPTFWNGSLEYQPKVAELNPLFVLRNYPNNINNWNVNPCIEWMTRKLENRVEYCFNPYVGAIFDTRYIRQNVSIQNEEYEILFSYISNRFIFAEIILSDNLQELTSACEELTTEYGNGREKNYSIAYYAFQDAESVSIQELSQSAAFLKFINEIRSDGKCDVRGVHIDLSIYDIQTIINHTKIVKTLGEKIKESGIKTGILLNSTGCMDVFQLILLKNFSILQILASFNYLVCKEKFKLTLLDEIKTIGKVLDTHLYLQHVFREFYPNWYMFFRIEVDVILDDDQIVMKRYLRLISHLEQFGEAHNINYFVVQAFDEEGGSRNGWWTNNVYTNLADPSTYVEKESKYAGRQMWRPAPLAKQYKIPPNEYSNIPPFRTNQKDVKSRSKKLRDVTDPLNALIQGEISQVDFFTKSGFVEKGAETEAKLNLYSPDCSTIQDCVDEINTVGRFWNDTLGRDMLDLTMSIPLNNQTLAKLANDNKLNVTLKRPDFETNYLFNINESMACDDIPDRRNEVWNYLTGFSESGYEIGINEVLIDCEAAAQLIRYSIEWVVVHIKFGDTVGIPESFGVFRKRMAYMHAETVKIVQKHAPRYDLIFPVIWYYPAVEAVGDENHYRLFENYIMEQDERIDGMEFIIRTKLLSSTENDFDETSNFAVVPYMYSATYSYSLSSAWTFSQHFKKLILDYDGWNNWNSNGRKELYNNSVYEPPLDNKIEVILDYSIAINNGMIDNTGKPFRDILDGIQDVNSMKPFVAKSILFSIETQESTNYSAKIYTNIGQQITSHGVEVGCVYVLLPESATKSAAADIVQACNEINGTIYILQHHVIYLRNDSINPFYYENKMRKILESAKEFRNLILQFHPSAQVYFKLPIIPIYDIVQGYTKGITTFCNENILSFNDLIEAITNWAKLNDFPVILKSAVDSPNHFDYLSWFSYLIPTFWNGSLEYQPKVAEVHPLFVLRNYPKNINNWNVDPCIDWMTSRPEIGDNYFYKKHVGAIFDTRYIRQNEPILSKEYDILVRYISNRFVLAEIILSDNWKEFTRACIEFTTKYWYDPKNNYLIGYAFRDAESVSIQELTQSYTFFKFLNEFKSIVNCDVKGVHIDLSIYDAQTIINETKIIKTLKEKGLEFGINIGIIVNSTTCMDVFQLLLVRDVSIPPILAPLNYLVCKERYKLTWLDKIETIGKVLDTHLYLKRLFREFQPYLDIYFRIEVDVTLDEDQIVMERYLRLISHLKQFGKAYDISYFVVQAFDEEGGRRNGWWTNNVYTNSSDAFTYVEKQFDYAGQQTWSPASMVEGSTIPPIEHSKLPQNNHSKIPQIDHSDMSVTNIVSVVFLAILVFGLMALSAFHYMRYKKMRQFLSDEEVKEFKNGKPQATETSVTQGAHMCASVDYIKFHKDYDLQLADFCIDQESLLGTGNFGVVHKGTAKGIPAAIKQPNKNCSKGSFKSFLMEIKVHCYIGVHTNIVGFIGAYTKEIHKGTLLIATELCLNGSLKALLRRKTTVTYSPNQNPNTLSHSEEEKAIETHDLCRFSHEIASGMDYLQSKQVVHADLSARNVLLNENYTCKIGDFGLSRKLYEYQKYVKKSQEPLPWKWMAYESLTKMEFTSKSDMWSYGVTLWEIFSLGKIPYGPMNWTLEFPDELQNGLRLGKPEFSSEQIYEKMLECWNLDIELRPKFSELVVFFREIGNVDYTVLGD